MIRTLKGKISLVYVFLVFMLAVIGSMSVVNLYRLSKEIDLLMVRNYKSINAVSHMLEAFERQDSAALIYINVNRQKGIELFANNSTEFMKWYTIGYDNITETGEKELLSDVNKGYQNYTMLFSKLQEIRNQDGLAESAAFYDTTMMHEFENLKIVLRQIIQLNEDAMLKAKNSATDSTHTSMYVILTVSAFAVIGGFILSRYFTGLFLKPLYMLTKSIKAVKAGNWNQQIDIITNDEIGDLSQEFNNMTKRLYQYEQSTLGKLLTEKNRTLVIVKSIPDPLIVLDTSYRIMLLNDACEMFFGIEEEKALKKHFLEVIRNEELFDIISNTYENKEVQQERIIHIEQKESFYFNVIVTMAMDLDLKQTGYIILLKNVTQLKQAEKTRSDFIATISHEFKTPLTSIMMGTSMFLDGSTGTLNDEQRDILNTIKEDGERLTTLVNDVLELSRIESGKSIYNMEACSVFPIINNSIKQFTMQAEYKNVTLINKVSNNFPKVFADEEKITWVVNNLISNALKYTAAGDEIVVSAHIKDEKLYVYVKDTGTGIPEEFQSKIFDKYVQVRGQDLEVRGAGLGLAVVREIVNAHGGEIWCESKLDTGSTFVFTLLLCKTEELNGKSIDS